MSQERPAAASAFTTALLLTQSEDFAVIDRRALREAGIGQVRVMTCGLYAVRFLAGREKADRNPRPDIVLVHQQLADMSGRDFARLVRSHPRLVALPVIYVSAEDTPAEKSAALAREYSGLLVRPYSGEGMRRVLEHAAACRHDREQLDLGRALLNTEVFDKALERFEAMLGAAGEEKPESSFRNGLLLLQKREWDAAIQAFQRALRQLSFKGEAEFGLALAWKGKGDQQNYKRYLAMAGQSFTQAAKWHKARTVYARLLRDAPGAENPFLREAERLIRAGAFEEAATALAEGYELAPVSPISERLARTLIYNSETPERDADALSRSLRAKIPDLAEELSGEMREEISEHMRRRRQRRQEARSAPQESARIRPGVPLGVENLGGGEAAPPGGQSVSRTEQGIALLSASDLSSSLFSDKPGMNEALTVAKLTWKLFRAGKL